MINLKLEYGREGVERATWFKWKVNEEIFDTVIKSDAVINLLTNEK